MLGRGEVICGWDEGLTHLSLGEKATLVCAPDMAYGADGMGGGFFDFFLCLVCFSYGS